MDLEILDSTTDVIEALGGIRPVAALTASKPTAVSNWRNFKSFPSNTYLVMTQALAAIGKSAPASLWGQKTRGADSENSAAPSLAPEGEAVPDPDRVRS